jgi:multiple sugar transport system permease protein
VIGTNVQRALRKRKGGLRGFLGGLDQPKRLATLLLLPLALLLLVLVVLPLLFELYLSLTNWQANSTGDWMQARWVWLANYQQILVDARFLSAVVRTIVIVATALVLECALGLGLALLFVDKFVGKRTLTSVILVPMMVLPLVIGFTFYMVFLPTGPVNGILSLILQRDISIAWLNNGPLTVIPIILADVYQWTPLTFMIFLGGLLAIPEEVNNAALILGSSNWQLFRTVTLPLLRPWFVVALVIRAVESLKMFDIVWVMTRGGPMNQTETIASYFYQTGYTFSRFSYVAAGAIVVLIFISAVAWQATKVLRVAGKAQ